MSQTVDSSTLVQRWRQRQQTILAALPPEQLAEFRKLAVMIREVQAEVGKAAPDRPRRPRIFGQKIRVRFSEHRSRLITYLRGCGSATRADIIANLGIPAGSLSELLLGREFRSIRRGLWTLREECHEA